MMIIALKYWKNETNQNDDYSSTDIEPKYWNIEKMKPIKMMIIAALILSWIVKRAQQTYFLLKPIKMSIWVMTLQNLVNLLSTCFGGILVGFWGDKPTSC